MIKTIQIDQEKSELSSPECWEESFTILLSDIGSLFTTHGTSFFIDSVACHTTHCWIANITINGVSRGRLDVGNSIVVDGVTFYLKSSPPTSGLPIVLVLSGGGTIPTPDPETSDDLTWILLGVAIVGLYLYLRK